MNNPATIGGLEGGTPDGCNTPAVQVERRILEYGLACAERAREQVMETRQRISEALRIVSEGVQA